MTDHPKFDFDGYAFDRSLVLCGPTGVGKTYTAKQLYDRYSNDKYGIDMQKYMISDGYFKQMVKANMLQLRPWSEAQCSLHHYPLELMIHTPLLVYDDIGVSDVSDAYLRDFTFVLDERMKRWLVTIFTTNLTGSELKSKLNERAVSRMLSNANVINFSWEDRRRQTTKYFKA